MLPGKALAQEGLVQHTKDGPAILLKTNQRSPQRLADDKRARAVDRVDDPGESAGTGNLAKLLADNDLSEISEKVGQLARLRRPALRARYGRGENWGRSSDRKS